MQRKIIKVKINDENEFRLFSGAASLLQSVRFVENDHDLLAATIIISDEATDADIYCIMALINTVFGGEIIN